MKILLPLILTLASSARAQLVEPRMSAVGAISSATITPAAINCSGNTLQIDGTTLVADCVNNRVGVNTASPGTALSVNGVLTVGNETTKTVAITPATSGSEHILATNTGTESVTLRGGAGLSLQTYDGGWVEGMKVLHGKVGIGTASPGSKLHVSAVGGQSTGTVVGVIENTSGNTDGGGALSLCGASYSTYKDTYCSALAGIWDGSAVAMPFYIGGVEKMRIKQNGNVGIGTASPETKLHVQYDDNRQIAHRFNEYQISRLGVESGGALWAAGISHNGVKVASFQESSGVAVGDYYYQAAPSNGLIVPGNVGVGTTLPATKLEVVGAVQFGDNGVHKTTFTSAGGMQLPLAASDTPALGDRGVISWGDRQGIWGLTAGGLYLRTLDDNPSDSVHIYSYANREIARFQDNGQVGINTAAPHSTTTLHVNGNTMANCQTFPATNYSGAAMSSGTLVELVDYNHSIVAVTTTAAGSSHPAGSVVDESCAAGAICAIGHSGLCPVLLATNKSCTATDDVLVVDASQVGRADCVASTSIPDHFLEVGHPAYPRDSVNGQVVVGPVHFN